MNVPVRRYLVLFLLLLASSVYFQTAWAALSIGGYTLINTAKVGAKRWEFTYKAVLTNTGPSAILGATANLTARSSRDVGAVDAQLNFGPTAVGAKSTSTDTFSIRRDDAKPLSTANLSQKLQWQITPSTNAAPIASAGPDQTVDLGTQITLDGSASSDPNGDPLTFRWKLLSAPTGSAAILSGATTVNPQFVADKAGTYQVQLIVNDGKVDSTADIVLVSTFNSPPVANAGPDQTVFVGTTVTLDGSASSDVDGNALTYQWSFTDFPGTNAPPLSDATAVRPTFQVAASGSYTLQLVVNDGTVDSAIDTVVITTQNSPPAANAGPDQTVFVGTTVTLDGSASSDVDGNALTYRWSFTSFPGTNAPVLSDATATHASFKVDASGSYALQLVVNDGAIDSAADIVVITTKNSPPVADAGLDQTVPVGSSVSLDGSGSHDADGNALTYIWSLTTFPGTTPPTLSDASSVNPSFTVGSPGTYTAQLIVNDGTIDSAPDTVVITTQNSRPVANAGPDRTGLVGQSVSFDGSQSSDADHDALTFSWSLLSKPTGSTLTAANLSGADTATFSLVPDAVGEYIAQLIVSDGTLDSAADTASLTVENRAPLIANTTTTLAATEGTPFSVQILGSDPDGHAVSYSLTTAPANMVISATGEVLWPNPVFGTSTFTVQVTDSLGASISLTFTVNTAAALIPVPNVVGQTQEQATLALTQLGLVLGTVTTEPSGTVPAGSVIGQTPVAGTLVGSASVVDLVISSGQAQVLVPNVVGLSEAQATSNLTTAGFVLGVITRENSVSVPFGEVVSQSPVAGGPAASGAAINLVISLGPTTNENLPPDPATVAPPVQSGVASNVATSTSFLYSGTNPVQTGVAPGAIDLKRSAVVRGRVLDKLNNPLSGVALTIKDHPELGQTISRADGQFDLAVNGGGQLTLDYQKSGYISVQRQASVDWQAFTIVADVVMIPQDSKVTTIDFTQPVAMQVAKGSPVVDADGTRQATVLFPQGTGVQLYNPDGTTRPVDTLNLRFTEFTVGPNGPATMPAPLPPTSAYTYAVGLDADEATTKIAGKDVLFSQPVYFYAENFLKFPVGIHIPVGYYDNDKSAWIPSQDGRVIKILSVTNGLADLDTDGNGTADNDPSLGITSAERAQLANLYVAGQSLQRVPLTHFSRIDLNFPITCPPGQNCQGPTPPNPPTPKEEKKKKIDGNNEKCPASGATTYSGSIIECENQILGESVELTATPFSLNYRSDRVPGNKTASSVIIPLTGTTVSPNLQAVNLTLDVAGRRISKNFAPSANLSYTFEWDGFDAYGRPLQGEQAVTATISYGYPGVYAVPPSVAASFALASGTPIAGGIPARSGMSVGQSQTLTVAKWQGTGMLSDQLGGWSLSAHHTYEPQAKLLFLGTGERKGTDASNALVIRTVAGGVNSPVPSNGDGGPATQANVFFPSDVAVTSSGDLYIAQRSENRIRRIGADGNISTVADAATGALDFPDHIVVGPDDSIYYMENSCRIRRMTPNGDFSTVAGNGTCGFSGDGGPAIDASILRGAFDVGQDGSIYIAIQNDPDGTGGRIRRVGPDGTINTMAGGNRTRFVRGDGGPAQNAFMGPLAVAVGPDGSVYIGDDVNQSVRKISPNGIITTVAGGGTVPGSCFSFFCGNGGPAIQARFQVTWDIEVASDGSLYVLDHVGQVRRIGLDGIINRIAGIGCGFPPCEVNDGESAAGARIGQSQGIALDSNGNLFIAESTGIHVYRVSPALPAFDATDLAVPSSDGNQIYQFDSTGRHLRTLHALTGSTLLEFGYDAEGRLITATDANGNVTRIERDPSGNATAIVAPFGQRTTMSLDPNGFLAGISNPAGEAYHMAYTADGLLTGFTDPKGNTSTMTYDAAGKLLTDTNALGAAQTLARADLTGNDYLASRTTALGRKTTHRVEFPGVGGMRRTDTSPDGTSVVRVMGTDGTTQMTSPDGTTSLFQDRPDPRFGLLSSTASNQTVTTGGLSSTSSTSRTASLTNPGDLLSLTSLTDTFVLNGRASTSTFTTANKTFTSTSAAGRTSRQVIDSLGRVTQTAVPGIQPVNTSYDPRGRPDSVTQGNGADARTLAFAYNPQGYLASVTDPLGRSVGYEYDLAGRVTTQTLADGRQIHFGYDVNGNLTSLQPPGKLAHVFHYTSADQTADYVPPNVTGVTNPSTVYTYDLDKALTSIARPDGLVVNLVYDTAGRLSKQVLQPANTTLDTYAYNATTGKLISITEADGGVLGFTYTGALQTATTWTASPTNPVTGSVGFTYDNDFRVATVLVNGTNPFTYVYDADSLVTAVGAETLSRDAQNGRLTGTTLGTVTDTLSYDPFGAMANYSAKVGTTALFGIQFTRDKLGRITQKQETVNGVTDNFVYDYDLAGRLVKVTRNGAVQSTYTYDDNGNRLTRNLLGTPINGTYDDQDRLLTYGANTYTYTANGELSSKTTGNVTTTYQYDVLGNLKHVSLPGGTNIDYLVDGQNRRIGKKVNGTLVQGLLYQDQLKPIAELDGNNAVVSRFVYATHVNVPDYMIKGGVIYRIITDHLGSPRFVVNTTDDSIAQQMEYDEFGNVLADSNPGFQPFGFAGGLYDLDTRLIRFGSRDYEADFGRWLVKDLIGFNGGDENLYGYVLNTPVNLLDYRGTNPAVLIGICSAAVGLATTYVCVDKAIDNVFNDPNSDCTKRSLNPNSSFGGIAASCTANVVEKALFDCFHPVDIFKDKVSGEIIKGVTPRQNSKK